MVKAQVSILVVVFNMWHKLFFLWNIVYILNISAEEIGEECVPNNKISDGVCTLITNCEVALSAIRNKKHHAFERCGFDDDFEIVCCPRTTEKFGKVSERKADLECKKIIASKLVPIDLHIIGGERAALGEFPHMVALGYDKGDSYDFNCGGALISTTFVLTAAHCLTNLERIRPSIVRAGVVELGSKIWNEETDYVIADSIVHPEYTRSTKYHDLALIRLEKPIKISSILNPVCLYTKSTDPDVPLTITGWGKTSESKSTLSDSLLKTSVSTVGRAQCSPSYSNWRKLPNGIMDGQICAGDPQGGHDACQGDSGGPLQLTEDNNFVYSLVGVTSFGNGCGSTVPGVYTRVAQYLDWIESVVWP